MPNEQSPTETAVPSTALLASSRVPRVCPQCGCQTRDPFRGEIVIHDVFQCAKTARAAINMHKSIARFFDALGTDANPEHQRGAT